MREPRGRSTASNTLAQSLTMLSDDGRLLCNIGVGALDHLRKIKVKVLVSPCFIGLAENTEGKFLPKRPVFRGVGEQLGGETGSVCRFLIPRTELKICRMRVASSTSPAIPETVTVCVIECCLSASAHPVSAKAALSDRAATTAPKSPVPRRCASSTNADHDGDCPRHLMPIPELSIWRMHGISIYQGRKIPRGGVGQAAACSLSPGSVPSS